MFESDSSTNAFAEPEEKERDCAGSGAGRRRRELRHEVIDAGRIGAGVNRDDRVSRDGRENGDEGVDGDEEERVIERVSDV